MSGSTAAVGAPRASSPAQPPPRPGRDGPPADAEQEDDWRAILDAYVKEVRPVLFGPEAAAAAAAAANEAAEGPALDALLDCARRAAAAASGPDREEEVEGADAFLPTPLRDALERLACDLDRAADRPAARHRLLPPLVRLLTCVWEASHAAQRKRTGNGMDHDPDLERRCAAAVLALAAPWSSSGEPNRAARCCREARLVVPIASTGAEATALCAEHLDLTFLEGESDPPGEGNDLRSAIDQYWAFWHRVHRSVDGSDAEAGPLDCESDLGDGPSSPLSTRQLAALIASRWTIEGTAKAVRDHFFGLDRSPDHPEAVAAKAKAVAAPQTRLFLGTTVPYRPDPDGADEAPYLREPSRGRGALHFAALLAEAASQDSHPPVPLPLPLPLRAWDELVPVADQLLAAPRYDWQARGAILACRLLDACEAPSASSGCAQLYHPSSSAPLVSPPCWESDARVAIALGNWQRLLSIAERICRDGPALAALGAAHCRVLAALQRRSEADGAHWQSQRRAACQHWLAALYQNQGSVGTQPQLVLGLLLGIARLLHDLVLHGRRSGEGVELGRLGLAAILPLLRRGGDGLDGNLSDPLQADIRDASVVALHNLLVAAHPIVPRHSGKIMCHLLAVCGALAEEASDDFGDQRGCRSLRLATRVAAVAWVLCDSNSNGSGEDLEARFSPPGRVYRASFLRVLRSVKEYANQLAGTAGGPDLEGAAPGGKDVELPSLAQPVRVPAGLEIH